MEMTFESTSDHLSTLALALLPSITIIIKIPADRSLSHSSHLLLRSSWPSRSSSFAFAFCTTKSAWLCFALLCLALLCFALLCRGLPYFSLLGSSMTFSISQTIDWYRVTVVQCWIYETSDNSCPDLPERNLTFFLTAENRTLCGGHWQPVFWKR